MDGPMDGPMDGLMDGRTDPLIETLLQRPSYRDAWTHLKTKFCPFVQKMGDVQFIYKMMST